MNRIILETSDVIKQYKQFDDVVTAVNRVSFKVEEGEFAAIIGASGSGKSTLLQLCGGLDRPNHGKIFVRGEDITRMKADDLNRYRGQHIGFIFQKHNLLPKLSALDNILLPTVMCNKAEYRYEESLKQLIRYLNLEDRLRHLPSELSGGQQQRVAIARALINRPQILLADEPTGNLDHDSASEVLSLLLDIRKKMGQTIVLVTHDLEIADHADKIYMMNDGKLYLYKDEEGYRRVSYEKTLDKLKHTGASQEQSGMTVPSSEDTEKNI